MRENLRRKGSEFEKIAGMYLANKGYEVLEYNFRCRNAEIDIVARKEGVLVFCEVKYRKESEVNAALEAVTIQKQRKISMAALYYLTIHGFLDTACRFDVIGISGTEVIHIENAFDYLGA